MTRKQLEAFHGKANPQAVETAWPHLNSDDRFIRFAARTAIEFQPVSEWRERALNEAQARRRLWRHYWRWCGWAPRKIVMRR